MRRCCLLIGFLTIASFLASAQTDDDQRAQDAIKGGEKISTALASVTSTAISPLLGVCALGAWQYYHTPKEQRDRLPLIQKPKFWIPIVLLLVLIFIKDTCGGFAPLIKKPLDAAEVLFVNHAALVLVAFPFVLNQVSRVMGFTSWKTLLSCLLSGPVVYAATPETGGLQHAVSLATALLYTAVGVAVTFVVWLVGHAFDVLAMISPFPFLDFLLKAVRNAVFAVLAITALLSPHLGLLLSLAVILVSILIFGWALRMAFFGVVFAWSLLRVLLMEAREKVERGDRVKAFTARAGKLPRRTYGHLSLAEDGTLLFCYRRLLVGPQSTLKVGRSGSFSVAQGIFFPSVIEPIESTSKHQVTFRLLPTYRGAEESIRACLALAQVRDLRWTKGLRSFWKFVTDDSESTAEASG